MGKRKYLVVSPVGKQEIVVDEDQLVMEVRGVIHALLGVPLENDVIITSCGKRILDSLGTWQEAMSFLFPDRYASMDLRSHSTSSSSSISGASHAEGSIATNSQHSQSRDRGGPVLEKLHCSICPKQVELEPSSEALRAALPVSQRSMSNVERERMLSMYTPMVEMMANNPSMLRSMFEAQGINPDHPQIREMMNNKEFLKRVLLAGVDPDAQRSLSQEVNLQMAQIEAMPEGSYMLQSMLDQAMNDKTLFLDERRSALDLHPASEDNSRPVPSQAANTQALPNPWNDHPIQAPAANHGMQRLQEQHQQQILRLQQQQQQQRLQLFQQQQQQRVGTNPLAAFFSLPPSSMVMPNVGAPPQQQGQNSHVSHPAVIPSAQDSNASPLNVAGSSATTSASTFGSSASSAEKYHTQLQQLKELGFEDASLCLQALQATNGDLGHALDFIEAHQMD